MVEEAKKREKQSSLILSNNSMIPITPLVQVSDSAIFIN